METQLRTSLLPKEISSIFPILKEHHYFLAKQRVLNVEDAVDRISSTVKREQVLLAAKSVWNDELNQSVSEWLHQNELNPDFRYEAWVLWSLKSLVDPIVEMSKKPSLVSAFVLPPHLRYFETEARKARLTSEKELLDYVASATAVVDDAMGTVAETMLKNNHCPEIYAYLSENSIVDFESSRWLYWYLGALDFAGKSFD